MKRVSTFEQMLRSIDSWLEFELTCVVVDAVVGVDVADLFDLEHVVIPLAAVDGVMKYVVQHGGRHVGEDSVQLKSSSPVNISSNENYPPSNANTPVFFSNPNCAY